MSEEEQDSYINGFKKVVDSLTKPLTIDIRRSFINVPLEDIEVKTTTYEFYVSSTERLDRLLELAGLRYEPLIELPPRPINLKSCKVMSRGIICRGRVYKVLTVYGLPQTLMDGFLYNIYPLVDEVLINIVPITQATAIKIIRSRLKVVSGLVSSYEVEGRTPKYEVVEEFRNLDELLKSLVRREVRLYGLRLAFVVSGSSHGEVKERFEELKRELESYGFLVDSPAYLQWLIYELKEPNPILTNTLTLSTFFPFISTTLTEVEGIFLGRSRLDDSPVFLDIWSHKSYNISVLGMMGTGKSALAKKLIYEYHRKLANTPEKLAIFVIDRTGEYIPVLSSIGAQVVIVERDRELGFDPLRLLPPEHAASYISAIAKLDPKLSSELHRLAARCRSFKEIYENASRDLKSMLSGVLEGPLGWVFRGKPLSLKDRVGVILKELGSPEAEGLVGAMFLLAFIQKIKALPKDVRKILVIDEYLQVLEAFRTYDVMNWLLMFFKNTRKWFTSVVYIAHDPREISESRHGRVIAAQLSAIKVLFQHDVDASRSAKELFGLSDAEVELIVNAGVGDCLLIVEGMRLPVHVELSRKELELVETRPTAWE